MGLIRLAVYDRRRIPPDGVGRVYICGPDDLHGELPWFGRAYFSGNQLVIERNESDSGCVYVPWRLTGHGELTLATAPLMERNRPYQLEVELARGTLNRLRNQLASWEMMGLETPTSLAEPVRQSMREFAGAATHQSEPAVAAEKAQQSLATAVDAMNQLIDVYTAQALAVRRTQAKRLNTLLGAQLGSRMPALQVARQLPATFNLAAARMNWRAIESNEGRRDWNDANAQVEWAQQVGLKLSAGPLLDFTDAGIPDWAYLWEGDFNSVRAFMLDHVKQSVNRYRGKVQLWQLAARMCHGHVLALTEEQRLQIVAQAIATAREVDPRTPIIISFDQPWGEHLAVEATDLAPLHFADALVRADLGLSGIGLELSIGYHPRASDYRTPLAISRLIDCWSLLDLPLVVALTVPSLTSEDPKADGKIHVLGADHDTTISPESQRRWVQRHVPLLLAKSSVQVILWNQLSDAVPHEFPHGGLFDADDQPKPVLETLRNVRREFLM